MSTIIQANGDPSGALILCEAAPRWSVAWRRALRNTAPVQVIETRSLVQCAEALAAQPRSLVGIDVSTDSLPRVLMLLARLHRNFPAAAFLALADRKLRAAEPFLRDAGAFHVIYSCREVPLAVRFVRRQLLGPASERKAVGATR